MNLSKIKNFQGGSNLNASRVTNDEFSIHTNSKAPSPTITLSSQSHYLWYMSIETERKNLIERLKKIRSSSTLKQVDKLLTQAELEDRAEESIQAIEAGNIIPLQQFSDASQKWLKKSATK